MGFMPQVAVDGSKEGQKGERKERMKKCICIDSVLLIRLGNRAEAMPQWQGSSRALH